MDTLFKPTATIFYQFATFALEIIYDSASVIEAKFSRLDDEREMFSGGKFPFAEQIIKQLDHYVKDANFTFTLALKFNGSLHQLKLWQLMRQIQAGQVLSYGEAAALLNSAPRAIGGACGKNPLPIFIPCHRIIAANNKLGGFNSGNPFLGLEIKKWLLRHEGVVL